MNEDKLLDLVTDIAPKHEFIDPETGIKDFSVLGFSREFAAAIEQAARREALKTALGICAAVMTDSMNKDGEAACEACMVAIRALMGEEGK